MACMRRCLSPSGSVTTSFRVAVADLFGGGWAASGSSPDASCRLPLHLSDSLQRRRRPGPLYLAAMSLKAGPTSFLSIAWQAMRSRPSGRRRRRSAARPPLAAVARRALFESANNRKLLWPRAGARTGSRRSMNVVLGVIHVEVAGRGDQARVLDHGLQRASCRPTTMADSLFLALHTANHTSSPALLYSGCTTRLAPSPGPPIRRWAGSEPAAGSAMSYTTADWEIFALRVQRRVGPQVLRDFGWLLTNRRLRPALQRFDHLPGVLLAAWPGRCRSGRWSVAQGRVAVTTRAELRMDEVGATTGCGILPTSTARPACRSFGRPRRSCWTGWRRPWK